MQIIPSPDPLLPSKSNYGGIHKGGIAKCDSIRDLFSAEEIQYSRC